ncbi:neuroendocrine convertase 1-like [Oppia nitens]|uniref:neuroendocrine convertase 1-like n=1 Tax=Oppia nitens TaxID=1686743 RepID=UPI0023DB7087|nr:neuroendocrine convertase 1-like [Oppia nitens]
MLISSNYLIVYLNILIVCFVKLYYNYNIDDDYQLNGHYMNVWAVHIPSGIDTSDRVAQDLGYTNLGQIKGLDNFYVFHNKYHPRRSKRHAHNYTNQLSSDGRIRWAEQQMARIRIKRGFIKFKDLDNHWTKYLRHSSDPLERGKKYPGAYHDHTFNDELWSRQWYLHGSRNVPTLPRMDHGVKEAWQMGFTGKGVVITILDDGLEWTHSDIYANYDRNASCDTNDNDMDPMPRYDKYDSNRHGTQCAGEIAMIPNNHKCGVGIAFNARIGGIRCLDGEVSDVIEAMSLCFNYNYIDIYSSSWGPSDDGMTVDGPKRLATEAILKGITYGRQGKGAIYVWASGNGGMKGDNCNCDGYVSSIYTIAIGSASQSGQFPFYGERCSSTLAVTYSSGGYTDQKIATIDLKDKCTIDHSGTSAAAPLAAGMIALMLEANPNLNWRDVQHLIVCTSQFSPLMENKSWKRNAAGFMYNSRFGFGLMKADLLVMAALRWTTVPPNHVCYIKPKSILPLTLSSGGDIQINFLNIGHRCCIKFIEQIQINLYMDYTRRGNLQIILISPQGTVSMLMTTRPKDTNRVFPNWNLTSVHFWGENPMGHWRLVIRDPIVKHKNSENKGKVKKVTLILHGTDEPSGCLKTGRRVYEDEDLIERTIDITPEYLEDTKDQNDLPNDLNSLKSPLEMDFTDDLLIL